LTTRICHVKALVTVGERVQHVAAGFTKEAARWVMVPGAAARRIPLMFEREGKLRAEAEVSSINVLESGEAARRIAASVSSPPARPTCTFAESSPNAPVLKLGLSCPAPFDLKCARFRGNAMNIASSSRKSSR
jgi:indolepyruvate ferredoxin oxidoreductase alpha subunit